jgi:chemotaxis protein MotB
MKKTFCIIAVLSLISGVLLTSCVPAQKLRNSEVRVGKLQSDSVKTRSQLNDCNTIVKNLKADNSSIQNEYALIQTDLNDLAAESKMTIADQAKRLKKLQDNIQAQKDAMGRLKNSLSDALMSYKPDELYVYLKNGNVYVSLEEKLLFTSGSDVVDSKGKEALKALAQVLNNTKNINVMVEGHTDNVPIKTVRFKDNWDLSTARATSILRILTKDYNFDIKLITASGRGQFHPLKSNETAAGRAANRRTEIILSPDLNELYRLLDN